MALSAPPPHPRGLPAETTSFVGRRREHDQVRRLLSGARLVTLCGVGGVGKTRLALQVARSPGIVVEEVWFVDLTALTDPGGLPQTVAVALGIGGESAKTSAAVLADYLAPRRLLLVLDNCEHLLRSCGEMVQMLLQAAPGLHVLATSTQPLGLTAEHTLVVPPLASLDLHGSSDPSEVEASDAVLLMIDRARAVLPEFSPDPATLLDLARLCARLDGLPLAIELAAARLRALSVRQLLDRIDERFDLLTRGSPAAHPRQQTLRALVDWSYLQCTPAEQMLWSRLSVFRGSLDLEAAQAVCGDGDSSPAATTDLIASLVEKSVLGREEHDGVVRYRLLETIAVYGAERLGEAATPVRRRHRDHFLARAERAEQQWQRSWTTEWWDQLRFDLPNFRAALEFCDAYPDDSEAGLRTASALALYWRALGLLTDGREWLDRALAVHTGPTRARAKALWANSWLATLQGDMERAGELLDECDLISEELADRSIHAHVDDIRGLGALLGGEFPEAVRLLEAAVAGHRHAQDTTSAVLALHRLAQAALAVGDNERARDLAAECLTNLGDGPTWVAIYARWVLGIATWQLGDSARAAELEREMVRTSAEYGDRLGVTLGAQALAWIAAGHGDPRRAAHLLGAVSRIWQETGAAFAERAHLVTHQDDCLRHLRGHLGERAVRTALEQGRLLSLNGLVADALATRPGDATERPQLTRREREIAEFVRQGLSNPGIARELVISSRTVDTHVQHILGKLGFSSRTQIGVWVADTTA